MIDLPSCLAHGAPRKCSQEVLWVGGGNQSEAQGASPMHQQLP